MFRAAPSRATQVRVGADLFPQLASDLAAAAPADRYVVISDRRVGGLYGDRLQRALKRRGLRTDRLSFPAGERYKTRETKQRIENRLLDLGAGRDSAIVALGGGVTGDLAGFVAATWQRGVPLVQVPTTLLAMVDASIGGKTAVNLPRGKNLVGAMHQPLAVYADVATLKTLPPADYRDGLAELVKAAVVADASLFRWVESNVRALLSRRRGTVIEAVARAIRIKGRVVRADEYEHGRRAILNFGHTIGHAIESAAGYRISHGRAVAIGMAVEARIAVAESTLSEKASRRIAELLATLGLPVEPPSGLTPQGILRATRTDKKSRRGRARYALPVALGRMSSGGAVTREIDETAVLAALRAN